MKRTLGDDLRDFKAGKINGNHYRNGFNNSENYIKTTSPSKTMVNESGKPVHVSYNQWVNQKVFENLNSQSKNGVNVSQKNNFDSNVTLIDNNLAKAKPFIETGVPNNYSLVRQTDLEAAYSKVEEEKNYEYYMSVAEKAKSADEKIWALKKAQTVASTDDIKNAIKSTNISGGLGSAKQLKEVLAQKEAEDSYKEQQKNISIQKHIEQRRDAEYTKKNVGAQNYDDFRNIAHNTTDEHEKEWANKKAFANAKSEDVNNEINKLQSEYDLISKRIAGYGEKYSSDEEYDNDYRKAKKLEEEISDLRENKLNQAKVNENRQIINDNVKVRSVLQKYYNYKRKNDEPEQITDTYSQSKGQLMNDNRVDEDNVLSEYEALKKQGFDMDALYNQYDRDIHAEKNASMIKRMKEEAKEHPVTSSVGTLVGGTFGSLIDAFKIGSASIDKATGGDGYIDTNSLANKQAGEMQESVSDSINNDVGKFFYNAGMSIAQNVLLKGVGMLTGPAGAVTTAGIMGTQAGVSAFTDTYDNKGDIWDSLATGVAQGIAEDLFESASLDKIIDIIPKNGIKSIGDLFKSIGKSALVEGSEEINTSLANALSDQLINGDKSQLGIKYNEYIENGYTPEQAMKQSGKDFGLQLFQDFAGGAFAGGILGAGGSIGNYINYKSNAKANAWQIGEDLINSRENAVSGLIDTALKINDDKSKAKQLAKKLEQIQSIGENINAIDVGNLYKLVNAETANVNELVSIAEKQDMDSIAYKLGEQIKKAKKVTPDEVIALTNALGENAPKKSIINPDDIQSKNLEHKYRAFAFGKNHKNGIIATNTSTGEAVKVSIKDLESSSKINLNDEENTIIFNTIDGKQVNADSITFSDSQLNMIVHSANEFDTYGARNYISNFEDWRESPQALKISSKEMLNKYNSAYSAAYNYGREGVKLDTLEQTSNYRILKKILGESIIKQAMSAGSRDANILTQHHANRLTELIDRNGRADTSSVTVYADNGTNVSSVPKELINALGILATKTGRNIIISDRIADGVNGMTKDGNIYLSSEITSQKILATALHEAGHMIKKTNPTEWRTLSDFVSDYLVRRGIDLNRMIDRTIERYGNRLTPDEGENTKNAALEEIVCDTLMSMASDEKALNIALSTNQNKSKIAVAIKSLINKIKDWLFGKSTNFGAKAFAKDIEALEQLAERFSEAADTARENITEQTEVINGERMDIEKFSIADDIIDDDGTHYGRGVVLDTKIFKNKKPRDWGKIIKKFVYDYLAGKQITVYDENNNKRIIEFVRLNERVKKDGANNSHKVIDKLSRKADNNSRLAVAHATEIIEVSNFDSNNNENSHQWLDENGWEYRNAYLINRKGNIYKATLNIGRSKDGRNILYDINKISNIGHGVVSSNGIERISAKRDSLINPNIANITISQKDKNVNEEHSFDEEMATLSSDDTDENQIDKSGVIHDTLKYSIDEEYDYLFDYNYADKENKHIDFEKAVDENNPELTIEQIYHHAARNVKEGLLAGKGIKPEHKKVYNIVKSVMRRYHINPNAEIDSIVTEYVDALNTFIDSVQNDKSSFTDAFESFVLQCKESLMYSTQLDEQHEAWSKKIRNELKGTTLLIPDSAIESIKGNYGSVGNYKKALFGKINVKLEHNQRGINNSAVGSYIENIGSRIEEIGSSSLVLDDAFDWNSASGYQMLERIVNYVLAPQYVSTYNGKIQSESTIDSAAIQMAFDTTAEYLKQQGKAAVNIRNVDRKKLRDINKTLKNSLTLQKALHRQRIKNYKDELLKQREKYNTMRTKYKESYNELKDKKSEQAKKMREKINELEQLSKTQRLIISTDKKTLADRYNEEKEKTRYRKLLGKMLDRLTKRMDGKAHNNEYIPESLKQPVLSVLSGFREFADPGIYKNGKQKSMPGYFGEWINVAAVGEKVRDLADEYSKLKNENKSSQENMKYSYIDINSIAYNEGTMKTLEALKDELAEYKTVNGEVVLDADGNKIKIGYQNIFTMSAENLKHLYLTMQELESSLREATEIIVDGQRQQINNASIRAIENIRAVNYRKDVNLNMLTQKSVGKKFNGALNDVKELSNKFIATQLDPVRYGRFLSGYDDSSVTAKIFKDLRDGDVKSKKIMQKAYTKVQSVAYSFQKSDLKKAQTKDVEEFDFRDIETGKHVKVSQGILMSIYLTDMQRAGRLHLYDENKMEHYTVLPDLDSANSKKSYIKSKSKSELSHKVRFTIDDLEHIKRYIQGNKMLRDISSSISEVLNNELQQEINEVSMQKYGMLKKKKKNYFPITVYGDGAVYEKDFSAEFNDMRMKSRGFTKQREISSAPIVIDDVFRVFQRHTRNVAEYCGLLTPIENFKKVYNWISNGTTMHEVVLKKFGNSAEHYIDKLMGDLQKSRDNIDDNFLTRMQGNYMGAVLLMNPGAMVKQFAAFPTANAYFGAKNVAIASAGGMWRVDLEKYSKYTPYLWYRAEGNGTIVGELSRETGIVGGLNDKIDIMGKVDRYVVGCLLKAAELHVEQTTKLKKGSDAYYKEVARQFEKCVDETRPNNMITTKPQFIRNNILKILSMSAFRSQNMAIGNTILDSYMEYCARKNDYKLNKTEESNIEKKAAMKKFAKSLIGATESALLIGGLTMFVNLFLWHKWDEERDENGNVTANNIFSDILDYSMESFAGTFVFGDTVYSAIEHMIDNDNTFYGLDSMSLENINNFIENISNGDYISSAILLGDCFGLPASNLKRIALSAMSYFTDLTKGSGEIITDAKGNINTTVLVPLFINSTFDGDENKAKYYKSLYINTIMNTKGKTDNEANDMFNQKLIIALAKNNRDIENAAISKANGDLDEYEKLINQVSSYGFDESNVIKASDKVLNNIISNLKEANITDEYDVKSDLLNQGFSEKGAEYIWNKMSSINNSEDTTKISSNMYTYSDAFEYLKNGDIDSYEKAEKYLMQQKNKTAEQIQKLMQSSNRTDSLFKSYIGAINNNDSDTTHILYKQLLNIYGTESSFKSALQKYQDKVKKQKSE